MEEENTLAASSVIGQHIAGVCHTADQDRQWIETRWIEDIIQLEDLRHTESNTESFMGDETVVQSAHRHNITKPKTLTAEARISDMLFQTEKNFSIDPDVTVPAELREQAEVGSDKLEKSIVELLDDSDYESQGRAVIKEATSLGVSLIEGPVKTPRLVKTWKQSVGSDGKPVNTLVATVKENTSVKYRTVWNYFPDMSAASHDDCSYEMYRHYMTRSDLQLLLVSDSGFNKEEILSIIDTESPAAPARYLTELRSSAPLDDNTDRFIIWKCHMTMPVSMIRDMCQQEPSREGNLYADGQTIEDVHDFEIEVLAWVSDSGKLLKFSPNPLETNERPYSVFCYNRDMTCFMASPGVPRGIRGAQRDVNASWDRIHDNADLSVGPQWIADPNVVEPMPIDGVVSWDMTANKGWRLTRPGAEPQRAFHFFNVPSGVEENMLILKTALQFADVETQLPQIASGEMQSGTERMAASGMELLIHGSNSTQRRIVKDYDDHVTIPLIGRLIDDSMQNNPIEGVEGRFVPNAHGTSALMLKEAQARNAVNLASIAGSNPHFAKKTDWDAMYDQILRGLQFDPKVVTYSDEEMAKRAEDNPPQPSPEQIEAQANMLEAQNEQAKIKNSVQESQVKSKLLFDELQLKRQKAQSEMKVAVMKVELEREKLERDGKGKVGKMLFDQKAAERKIKMEAGAKSQDRAEEYAIETRSNTKQQ